MMSQDELLDSPVTVLGLSPRPLRAIQNAETKTVRDLISCTDAELLRYPNFGRLALAEVKKALSRHGLFLDGTSLGSASESLPPIPLQPTMAEVTEIVIRDAINDYESKSEGSAVVSARLAREIVIRLIRYGLVPNP